MGFNEVLIKKVYIFLKPTSLEEAINYMSEENGIYQHNFFQNIKISNKQCYICGHPENEHINYNELTKDDELEEEIKGKSSIGNKLCSICFETYAPYDMYELKKCHHEYCYNCWFIHLKNKIGNSEIGKLKCIDLKCKEIIPEEFILDIIKKDKKLVEKYKRFSKRLKILEDPNKVFCPEPNYDRYAIKNKKIKYVKCENGHNFCCICMKKPHGKNSCENELEKDFQIWKKGKIIKQCPNCKIWTEKNEGCNHMKCVECKYEWCWLCSGKYSLNHFYEGKCNGLQFFKPKTEEDIKNALDKNINKKPIISNPVFRPLPRIEDTYGYQERIRNVTQQWREEEWRVGHIIIDNEHPYHFPSKRNNEYVDFFYAYAMMSKCDYFGYILLYFFMTLEFCGIIMHNRILNVEDPYYGFNINKIYMNKKFNIFILLSLVFMQFLVYFFFNLACMILITIPQIFYWDFFYCMRQGWYNVLIYNVTTGLLNIKVNYGR